MLRLEVEDGHAPNVLDWIVEATMLHVTCSSDKEGHHSKYYNLLQRITPWRGTERSACNTLCYMGGGCYPGLRVRVGAQSYNPRPSETNRIL